jgi:hypothetical protein
VDFTKHNISSLCEVHRLYNLSPVMLYMPSALSVGLRPLAGWDWGVRIPPGAWMSVSCLCVGLITPPEGHYRVWCVCHRKASIMRRPWPPRGSLVVEKKNYKNKFAPLLKHYTVKALAEQCLTMTLDLHQQSTSSPDNFTSGECPPIATG